MAPTSSKRYLCQAPRPDVWEDFADDVLAHLGKTTDEKIETLRQTIRLSKQRNPYVPKVGPGRKTNTEHAIAFYEHVLNVLEKRKKKGIESSGETDDAVDDNNSRESENDDEAEDLGGGGNDSHVEEESQAASSIDTQTFRNRHNEVCEVCDQGGTLLLCSTCNLAFHLQCTRPPEEKMPDESSAWRCSYCVLSTEPKNTKQRKVAAAGVRMMARLRNKHKRQQRLETGSRGGNHAGSQAPAPGSAVSERVEYKSEKPSNEANDESAIMGDGSNDMKDAADAVTAGQEESQGRARRNRKQPTLYDPQFGPARLWQSDELIEWKTRAPPSDSASESSVEKDETPGSSSQRDRSDSVYCGFCGDDPMIRVCCFCACRVCFGKHNKKKLLLCDRCDDEYHIFCLDPPLESVPKRKWYCDDCKTTEERRNSRSVDTYKAQPNISEPVSGRRTSARKISPAKQFDSSPPRKHRSPDRRRSDPEAKRSQPSSGQPRTKAGRFLPFPGRGPKKRTKSLSPPKKRTTDEEPSMRSVGWPSKRVKSPGTEQSDDDMVVVSRSGRALKRNTFHDELPSTEQHLKVPHPVIKNTEDLVTSNHEGDAILDEGKIDPPVKTAAHIAALPFISFSNKESDKDSKAPRRKPGARECMQISRRFGVDVIPEKYMDILFDYCNRGKVEHLIRMRERLDEHAYFLEAQLSGLDEMVAQKDLEM